MTVIGFTTSLDRGDMHVFPTRGNRHVRLPTAFGQSPKVPAKVPSSQEEAIDSHFQRLIVKILVVCACSLGSCLLHRFPFEFVVTEL